MLVAPALAHIMSAATGKRDQDWRGRQSQVAAGSRQSPPSDREGMRSSR